MAYTRCSESKYSVAINTMDTIPVFVELKSYHYCSQRVQLPVATKQQTHEAGAGAKGTVYSGAQTWQNGLRVSKTISLPAKLKAAVLTGIGSRGLAFP